MFFPVCIKRQIKTSVAKLKQIKSDITEGYSHIASRSLSILYIAPPLKLQREPIQICGKRNSYYNFSRM